MNAEDALTAGSEKFFIALGSRIAQLRKEAGLTQVQLAERIGVTQPVCASYEIGRRRIPVPLLLRIAEALNVYVEDLLPLENTKKKRGPMPKIDRDLARVKTLPRKQQQLVMNLIETVLGNPPE